jgi:hypothetical protein
MFSLYDQFHCKYVLCISLVLCFSELVIEGVPLRYLAAEQGHKHTQLVDQQY